MEKREFQELAERVSNGMASKEDVGRYNYYYNKFQENQEWYKEALGDKKFVEEELYERINANINMGRKRKTYTFFKLAAAIVIIIGAFIFYFRNSEDKMQSVDSKKIAQDVEPGSNKAVLILSDGSSINLDKSGNGTLASQGNSRIRKLSNGEVVYSNTNDHELSGKEVFNTIAIPRGGHYQLTLPDGTKVWLNASSSLKFPVAFNGNSREVELQGEAYFEVAKAYNSHGDNKNKRRKPFIVKTRFQKIEVLGTHFNVNAYADEREVNTTLIEGAVRIQFIKSGSSKVLKPGQHVRISATGDMTLTENTDTEEILAWKNNMFYFSNTDIRTIMRQLSRWYDVEINYSNMPASKKFNGMLSRDVKLSHVLKMMETTSNLKFKIEERKVSMLNN